jgi:hypothetical protein
MIQIPALKLAGWPLLSLGLVALGSIAFNTILLYQTGRLANQAETAADAREYIVRTELAVADNNALRTHIGLSALVTGWLASDRVEIMKGLNAVAERAQVRDVRWRDRDVPAPACGPGQEFVDATNELIGGEP